MAYEFKNKKGVTYYLHSREVELRGGKKQTIYYFARDIRPGALDQVPAGYKVVETAKTGMPILKKA
ncbi:MAG TPA: hypothetical protein PLP94_05290 [Candidatus Saccharicenans sp.]|jgi:hypothetical protein|nr:hypothetical protein [Candidatus Saccharicenans sp.]HOJ26596.1 hypothetical protein [Candidatus Saccharicenans sp.]HOL45663.1 hypothetical protein [Candidatus Saccharicenans sp.]HOM93502.1 hypothetical protein [Candidatus Saccharicenans sp.]HOT69312.1 hypothetical protein [Candidatus Saccharicenans sp.]